MIDAASQKLVCEPLKRGGRHCLFHACLFCVKPSVLGDAIIVFFDLETTGLSVLTDHIVEIGCVDAKGVVFTTVVNPLVLSNGHAVHGISDAELLEGLTFNDVFPRFVYLLVYKSFSQGGLRPDSKRVLKSQLVFLIKLNLSTLFLGFGTTLWKNPMLGNY